MLAVSVAIVVALVSPAGAIGDQPPSLPGPPPGAGSGFPSPPAPGTQPVAGPSGPATTIPPRANLPALLGGNLVQKSGRFTLRLACSGNGAVSVVASALGSGRVLSGRYLCNRHTATLRMQMRTSTLNRLRALRSVLAQASIGQGRRTSKVSLMLESRAVASSFFTDGGLECDLLAPDTAYVAAPNFTLHPPAIIDVRPWVAVFSARSGWQWVGAAGVARSTWYRWTATASGVMQWFTPAGALNPWTWAPITVRSSGPLYAIGAFEVAYRYAHPVYQWGYVRSYSGSGAGTDFCRYG